MTFHSSIDSEFVRLKTHLLGRNTGNISNNTSIVNKTHYAALYSQASALSSIRDLFTFIIDAVL